MNSITDSRITSLAEPIDLRDLVENLFDSLPIHVGDLRALNNTVDERIAFIGEHSVVRSLHITSTNPDRW